MAFIYIVLELSQIWNCTVHREWSVEHHRWYIFIHIPGLAYGDQFSSGGFLPFVGDVSLLRASLV